MDLLVRQQTISGSAGTGISVVRAAGLNVTIAQNGVTGSGREGIALEQAPGLPTLTDNTINGTGTCGILINNAPNVELSGNTVLNTGLDPICFVSPPTVTAISPRRVPTAGGNTVTITGTNLTGATDITFASLLESVSSPSFTVIGPTQITATVPAHATGAVDVRVVTPGGLHLTPQPTTTRISRSRRLRS